MRSLNCHAGKVAEQGRELLDLGHGLAPGNSRTRKQLFDLGGHGGHRAHDLAGKARAASEPRNAFSASRESIEQ